MMQALLIAICVFNAFFSFTAITLNIVTIIALRKPLTIPRALKILLLSMAVSDLAVGLLVQPLHITCLVMMIKQNTQTLYFEITLNSFYATGVFLTYASFFGVVALAADRFLALHLHLRYQELVTHNRVVAVVISIWIMSAIMMLQFIWIPPNVYAIISVTVRSVCYLTTALFYFKIYLAVRHHSNEIHVLQAQLAQNNDGDMAIAARERKAAVGTFYVYLVFLICYLPSTCFWIILRSAGQSTMLLKFVLYANTLIFLNSSLNPLIYSWKMRHVRHAIMEILRNILSHPHQWKRKNRELTVRTAAGNPVFFRYFLNLFLPFANRYSFQCCLIIHTGNVARNYFFVVQCKSARLACHLKAVTKSFSSVSGNYQTESRNLGYEHKYNIAITMFWVNFSQLKWNSC